MIFFYSKLVSAKPYNLSIVREVLYNEHSFHFSTYHIKHNYSPNAIETKEQEVLAYLNKEYEAVMLRLQKRNCFSHEWGT